MVKHNKSICSNTCTPATLNSLSQCETFEDYICNWMPVWETAFDEGFKKCPKHCKLTEYTGELSADYNYDNDGWITWEYIFDNELIEVYEEYLMYDIIGLIGTVGGTMGLFIGFSFFDISSTVIHFIFSFHRD